jgi:hypothetical protein
MTRNDVRTVVRYALGETTEGSTGGTNTGSGGGGGFGNLSGQSIPSTGGGALSNTSGITNVTAANIGGSSTASQGYIHGG